MTYFWQGKCASVLCNLQKELIREVEMGPFKHTVDDGLDIRKVYILFSSHYDFALIIF